MGVDALFLLVQDRIGAVSQRTRWAELHIEQYTDRAPGSNRFEGRADTPGPVQKQPERWTIRLGQFHDSRTAQSVHCRLADPDRQEPL